jgi:hypothetical protein
LRFPVEGIDDAAFEDDNALDLPEEQWAEN